MKFQWNADGIRFMKDASEYASYNQELVSMMEPYITADSHICDAGCGLGYLSLALAPLAERITAVDTDPEALEVLRVNCRERDIANVQVVQADALSYLPEEPYDTMVFCFFANMDEILETVKKRCRGTVIAVKKNYSAHRFSVGTHSCQHDSYSIAKARLKELGIPFESMAVELEFGQPFRTFEDARRFYEIYNKDEGKYEITDSFLRERLTETGDREFPYYMPHRRKVGLLKFDVKDI